MKRIWRVLVALGLALTVWVGSGAAIARADDDDMPRSWRISEYHTDVRLTEQGVADVTLTLTFNFANDPGHGPFISIPTRQAVDNPDLWLDLGYKLKSVTSPTGANTAVNQESNSDGVLLRIGTRGKRFVGKQTYIINYELTGLIASRHKVSGLDEFNWNFVGPAWQVPIESATATVRGPGNIERVGCFSGSSYTMPCQAETTGKEATYNAGGLGTKTPAQIVAGFPAGTFPEQTQTFSKRYHIGNMFPLNAATGGVTAAATLGAYALVRSRVRRFARDEEYLGLTPGLTPGKGDKVTVGARRTDAPIAVQFTPPKGARPGEIGTLIDATADNVDITATIIDLSVRGALTIYPSKDSDVHTLKRNHDFSGELVGYERSLLDALFAGRRTVTTKQLSDEEYAEFLPRARRRLYKRVVKLGWFRENPDQTRVKVMGFGFLAVAAGVVGGFAASLFGWGLVGLAGLITGVIIMLSAKSFTARTADGSAVLAQAKGFELYLSTAEANQIKFEEGIDVFSRYLPYAIVFGVADRWVKVFKELELAGIYTPDTTWYGGTDFYMFNAWSFTNSMNNFTSAMSDAMSSAISAGTAASSGGSGFSGGGGFGGGGGGGW